MGANENSLFELLEIVGIIFGAGSGLALFLFVLRSYINGLIRPQLYDDQGLTKYIPRRECKDATDEYRQKVCDELQSLKKEVRKITGFTSTLKGYYIGKGVTFKED